VLKHVGPGGLSAEARQIKPAFVQDSRREIAVYRTVLTPRGLGATMYGADDAGKHPWLLIERVEGRELYQVGDLDTWGDVAAWLGTFHRRLADGAGALAREAGLVRYDGDFYRTWPTRARCLADQVADGGRGRRTAIEWLAQRHDLAVEHLLALPVSLIHGECYASNVLVDDGVLRRICPVDWATAALGPGLLDLAALTAGGWSDAAGRAMVDRYAATAGRTAPATRAHLDKAMTACRLHVCMQWLGWFGRHEPPTAHAHDWLRDALELADQLLS
jgi:Ser/Thr protein kinase RdoA (MazF antagonist)